MQFNVGDRVKIVRSDVSDGSRDHLIGRLGTVVMVEPELSDVAIRVDADNRPWHAFSIKVLERTTR